MSLRLGLLWLTLNLALIIRRLSRLFLLFHFRYRVRCLCILLGVREPQVETTDEYLYVAIRELPDYLRDTQKGPKPTYRRYH
jgi:hypothetical protein